jgi:hypothetical protein
VERLHQRGYGSERPAGGRGGEAFVGLVISQIIPTSSKNVCIALDHLD